MKKSTSERKAEIIEKINKLKDQYKKIEKSDKLKERKARTKELIEIGADIKSKFSDQQIYVLRKLSSEQLNNVKKWLDEHSKELNTEKNFNNHTTQDTNIQNTQTLY